MLELTTASRLHFALICAVGLTLATAAFPRPRLTLTRGDRSAALERGGRGVAFPSPALSDWTIRAMPSPSLLGRGREAGTRDERDVQRFVAPSWPGLSVVADDAAFRERSRLLTSVERQKWLNSYMQKLLVVHSSG